jgi:hypothetical protein
MKRIGILLAMAIIILVGIIFFFVKRSSVITLPKKNLTTRSLTSVVNCSSKDLQASISFEGAAGNIYGNASVKNISPKECKIIGDNFITATFSAKNIKIMQQGQIGPNSISLSPNQIVYSQVHFPNGPQCMSGIKQLPVKFSYQISEKDSVTFLSTGNFPSSTITTCVSLTEMTQLDVWSISLQPLH